MNAYHRAPPWKHASAWALLLASGAFLCGTRAQGEAPTPPAPLRGEAETLFVKRTIAALLVPDLKRARAAAAATRLAGMFRQAPMRAFLKPALEALRQAYAELRASANGAQLPALADLGPALFDGEFAASLYARPGSPQTPLGLLIGLKPADPQAFRRLLAPLLGGKIPPSGQALPLGAGRDAPAWAYLGDAVLIGYPQADLPFYIRRAKNAAARAEEALAQKPSFQLIRKRLPKAQALFFLDFQAFKRVLLSSATGADQAEYKTLFRAFGLKDLDAWGVGAGFSGGEAVLESFLSLGGAAQARAEGPQGPGFLGMKKPIPSAALKIASPDAPFVCAGPWNAAALLPALSALLAQVDVPERDKFETEIALLNATVGFNLQKDLLENLGRQVVCVRPPIGSGFPLPLWPNLVCSVPIKDAAKVRACFKKLKATFAAAEVEKLALTKLFKLKPLPHGGQEILYLSSRYLGGGLSACIAGERLLLASTVSAMRQGLDQLQRPDDILANPDFRATLARLGGKPFDAQRLPPAFAYAADRGAGDGVLMMTGLGLSAAGGALVGLVRELSAPPAPAHLPKQSYLKRLLERPEGKTGLAIARSIDLGLWPDAGFFARHRRARGAVGAWLPEGLYLKSELPPPPLPLALGKGSSLWTISLLGFGSGLVLPALARAREQARRTQSASNLSQMGKAMAMYADVAKNLGRYPKTLTELYPDFVADPRLFVHPSYPEQEAGYIYVAGSTPMDGTRILVFENTPPKFARLGRNVLFGDGHVEWVSEAGFKQALARTKAAIKKAGGKLRLVPVRYAEFVKKTKK